MQPIKIYFKNMKLCFKYPVEALSKILGDKIKHANLPKTLKSEQRLRSKSDMHKYLSFLSDINEMVNSVVMATKNSCDKKLKVYT